MMKSSTVVRNQRFKIVSRLRHQVFPTGSHKCFYTNSGWVFHLEIKQLSANPLFHVSWSPQFNTLGLPVSCAFEKSIFWKQITQFRTVLYQILLNLLPISGKPRVKYYSTSGFKIIDYVTSLLNLKYVN